MAEISGADMRPATATILKKPSLFLPKKAAERHEAAIAQMNQATQTLEQARKDNDPKRVAKKQAREKLQKLLEKLRYIKMIGALSPRATARLIQAIMREIKTILANIGGNIGSSDGQGSGTLPPAIPTLAPSDSGQNPDENLPETKNTTEKTTTETDDTTEIKQLTRQAIALARAALNAAKRRQKMTATKNNDRDNANREIMAAEAQLNQLEANGPPSIVGVPIRISVTT